MIERDASLEALRNAASSEAAAYAFMESRRWGGSPSCPRQGCGSTNVYAMKSRDGGREAHYRLRCRACNRQFSVRTGTIMEESRLPLRFWVHAFWAAAASKKGVSALQISRELGTDYKTGLFLMHRIRGAMSSWNEGEAPKLTGTVEADETYIGGKWKNRHASDVKANPYGTPKVPVFGMVERGGDLRLLPAVRLSAKKLKPVLEKNIGLEARLMTDNAGAYRGITKGFKSHDTTNHAQRQYARGPGYSIHSNTIESAFSLLKRGVMGTFHVLTAKHMHRYCDEFAFRWNTRTLTDAERVDVAIRKCAGKRLTYRDQVEGREASWTPPASSPSPGSAG